MKKIAVIAFLLGALSSLPVMADDIEQGLMDALEAYQEGEVEETAEILAFVTSRLESMKADALAGFLPDAPQGWTKSDSEAVSTAGMAALGMGGGQVASANYSNQVETVAITLTVDNPMVSMIGGMLANPAMLGGQAEVLRINRQNVLITEDQQLQSVIDNRIMITIEGSENVDVLSMFFEAIDIRGLRDF